MNVTALIPAYNEEKTIGSIVETLNSIEEIDEIIVINDGSSDNTPNIAFNAGARVIDFDENRGKGAAIQRGIEEITSDIILMLDGDLIGFNKEHVYRLLEPLLNEEAEMTVGKFNHGRGLTDLAQFFTPNLSGQRAIKSDLLRRIIDLNEAGYGVEIALNKLVRKHGRLKYVELPELTHLMKEEKRGLTQGVVDRAKMYWDIIKILFTPVTKD